ncbi:MAG TPA: DUF721 domain-containing protein [Actinomycetota bacterium]|nr:DUF721 domain-containing protein [Actinomycetota bacterium]
MNEHVDAIAPLLNRVASKMGIERPAETARLFATWEAIVGPQIALRCQPTSLKEGVLRVRAQSPAWAAELRYLGPEVASRINAALGQKVVDQVKAWVPNPGGPTSRFGRRRKGGRANSAGAEGEVEAGSWGSPDAAVTEPPEPLGVPSETDIAMAEEMTSGIADERLAEITKRALLAGKMRRRQG